MAGAPAQHDEQQQRVFVPNRAFRLMIEFFAKVWDKDAVADSADSGAANKAKTSPPSAWKAGDIDYATMMDRVCEYVDASNLEPEWALRVRKVLILILMSLDYIDSFLFERMTTEEKDTTRHLTPIRLGLLRFSAHWVLGVDKNNGEAAIRAGQFACALAQMFWPTDGEYVRQITNRFQVGAFENWKRQREAEHNQGSAWRRQQQQNPYHNQYNTTPTPTPITPNAGQNSGHSGQMIAGLGGTPNGPPLLPGALLDHRDGVSPSKGIPGMLPPHAVKGTLPPGAILRGGPYTPVGPGGQFVRAGVSPSPVPVSPGFPGAIMGPFGGPPMMAKGVVGVAPPPPHGGSTPGSAPPRTSLTPKTSSVMIPGSGGAGLPMQVDQDGSSAGGPKASRTSLPGLATPSAAAAAGAGSPAEMNVKTGSASAIEEKKDSSTAEKSGDPAEDDVIAAARAAAAAAAAAVIVGESPGASGSGGKKEGAAAAAAEAPASGEPRKSESSKKSSLASGGEKKDDKDKMDVDSEAKKAPEDVQEKEKKKDKAEQEADKNSTLKGFASPSPKEGSKDSSPKEGSIKGSSCKDDDASPRSNSSSSSSRSSRSRSSRSRKNRKRSQHSDDSHSDSDSESSQVDLLETPAEIKIALEQQAKATGSGDALGSKSTSSSNLRGQSTLQGEPLDKELGRSLDRISQAKQNKNNSAAGISSTGAATGSSAALGQPTQQNQHLLQPPGGSKSLDFVGGFAQLKHLQLTGLRDKRQLELEQEKLQNRSFVDSGTQTEDRVDLYDRRDLVTILSADSSRFVSARTAEELKEDNDKGVSCCDSKSFFSTHLLALSSGSFDREGQSSAIARDLLGRASGAASLLGPGVVPGGLTADNSGTASAGTAGGTVSASVGTSVGGGPNTASVGTGGPAATLLNSGGSMDSQAGGNQPRVLSTIMEE
ncbi:unnamed protein product [Amoebophrya sp. A25]|nr:unnamed protein product [Amoebophrya sp. A25]|eukprot:GSA25T00010336001.1